MNINSLLGSTIRLVPLSTDHAEALLPSASDPEVWRWMPWPRPETVTQLFGHAFDDLRLARLALRTDHLNERSQRAMDRLGVVYEGALRSHMRRQDGTRRDSLYYSLLADEWPAVRDRLRARVAAKTTG